MIDLSNREATLNWFRNQSRDVAVAIAVRSALRVLPLLGTSSPLFSVFRASIVPWASLVNLANLNQPEWFSAAVAATHAVDQNLPSREAVSRPAAEAALFAVHAATTSAADATAGGATSACIAAVEAARAAHGNELAAAATLQAANADIAFIRMRGDSLAGAALALTPLWPGKDTPKWAAIAWEEIRANLLTADRYQLVKEDRNWEVWIDWYEDRLAGRRSEQAFNVAALFPDDFWKEGPTRVNSEIKRLINDFRKQSALPDEAALPRQASSAANFQRHESGVIDLVLPGSKDKLSNTDEVRDFYSEVRDKTSELLSLGANMLGSRLHERARVFQSRLPEDAAQAVERQVWSSGNTLRIILAAHDLVATDLDLHPDKLDRGAAERLRDVVDTFNQLAVADPNLRRRDASRPGPQEHQRSIDEINIVIGLAAEAAWNRSITTAEAGEELSDQIGNVTRVGSDIPSRLSVELARDTSRNFFAGTLVAVYRAVRNLPSMARGEQGFISKEFFGGFYKTAGASAYSAVLGGMAALYYVNWDIVQFIVSNIDVLKAYAPLAYEHSSGFMQMIEWINRHITPDKSNQI